MIDHARRNSLDSPTQTRAQLEGVSPAGHDAPQPLRLDADRATTAHPRRAKNGVGPAGRMPDD